MLALSPSSILTAQSLGPSGGGGSSLLAPDNFTATAGNETNALAWDAATGATSYDIYRSVTNDIGTASVIAADEVGLSYNDTSGNAGTKYYYWIVSKVGAVESSPTSSRSARAYTDIMSGGTKTLQTPPGSWQLSTLFFRSGGVLPANCFISFNSGADLANSIGGNLWEDAVNGGEFDPSISGAFDFDNQSGGLVTIWDTEP